MIKSYQISTIELFYVLNKRFGLDDFTIIEIDNLSKNKTIVYSQKWLSLSNPNRENVGQIEFNQVLILVFLTNSCELYELEGSEHICTSFILFQII